MTELPIQHSTNFTEIEQEYYSSPSLNGGTTLEPLPDQERETVVKLEVAGHCQ